MKPLVQSQEINNFDVRIFTPTQYWIMKMACFMSSPLVYRPPFGQLPLLCATKSSGVHFSRLSHRPNQFFAIYPHMRLTSHTLPTFLGPFRGLALICMLPWKSNPFCIGMFTSPLLHPYCKLSVISPPFIVPQGGPTSAPLLSFFRSTIIPTSPLLEHWTLPPCLTDHYRVYVKLFFYSLNNENIFKQVCFLSHSLKYLKGNLCGIIYHFFELCRPNKETDHANIFQLGTFPFVSFYVVLDNGTVLCEKDHLRVGFKLFSNPLIKKT